MNVGKIDKRQFIDEYTSERVIKTGLHLPELSTDKNRQVLQDTVPTVDRLCRRTLDVVYAHGEAGRVAKLVRVFVHADLHASVVRGLDVVVRIVYGLEHDESRPELVRDDQEGSVLVEDSRIAWTVLRF